MYATPIDVHLQAETDERARLVRWCARLTGDHGVAEDLAQETLLIAWQRDQDLRDPGKRLAWLMGIARNLCLNWNRRRARAQDEPTDLDLDQLLPNAGHGLWGTGGADLDVELERHELATLLDRALALLPAETRDVLVHRYVNESPHADIAGQLGLSEGAVKVRLHRGRLALRRLLATDLRQDAIAFGLHVSDTDALQQTRIWCPCCGKHRLEGRLDGTRGDLMLSCPGCGDRPPGYRSINASIERLKGLRSFKAALTRLLAGDPLRSALETGTAACRMCGRINPVKMGLPEAIESPVAYPYAVHIDCQGCGATVDTVLQGIALGLPETRRFWQHKPRMHVLPPREIEAAGSPMVVMRFASMTGSETLDVVFSRTTFNVVGVHGDISG
jgi:RNA polymerase sigma-70 factor (ECF subfamily)